jgi:hypothetical protein
LSCVTFLLLDGNAPQSGAGISHFARVDASLPKPKAIPKKGGRTAGL